MSATMTEKAVPPVRALFPRKPVFRRKFSFRPAGASEAAAVACVAEFHEDKLVLRRQRGRNKAEFTFAQLFSGTALAKGKGTPELPL